MLRGGRLLRLLRRLFEGLCWTVLSYGGLESRRHRRGLGRTGIAGYPGRNGVRVWLCSKADGLC